MADGPGTEDPQGAAELGPHRSGAEEGGKAMKGLFEKKYLTARCPICGGHTSSEDHTECSKVMQERHRDANEKKRPPKRRYSPRHTEEVAAYFSRRYGG